MPHLMPGRFFATPGATQSVHAAARYVSCSKAAATGPTAKMLVLCRGFIASVAAVDLAESYSWTFCF